jgi:hypothetical protein
VVSREFQSTCLMLSSPAIRTSNPPPKQAIRSARMSEREGDRLGRKEFHRSAGQGDLKSSGLQVGQARHGH